MITAIIRLWPSHRKHAVGDRDVVELKERGIDHCGEGTDHSRLILAVEFSADRTAALLQFLRRVVVNPEAPPAPDAGPVRPKEVRIEGPGDLAVGNDRIRRTRWVK